MNCLECGGEYIEKSGTYELQDPYVGKLVIRGFTYYQCDKCEDILYSESMAQEIEIERDKRIHEILSQFPISDFISSTETASILGISRQALHKNRRINHGFIYHIKSCGSIVYLKQSVLQYKNNNDGRFQLIFHGDIPSYEYVQNTIPLKILLTYESYPRTIKYPNRFIKERRVSPKEYNYAN